MLSIIFIEYFSSSPAKDKESVALESSNYSDLTFEFYDSLKLFLFIFVNFSYSSNLSNL